MRAFAFSWLGGGNLNNGANGGLWYVNANNALTNTNWNIGSRQSGWHSLSITSRLPRTRLRATRHACLTSEMA